MTHVGNIAEAVERCRALSLNRAHILVFPHPLGTEEVGTLENELRQIPEKAYGVDDQGDKVVVMRTA